MDARKNFSSPPPRKQWTENKKRKCSFGSAEKRNRKQISRVMENSGKISHKNWNQEPSWDFPEIPTSGSWADDAENEENEGTQRQANTNTINTRSKKQLNLNNCLDDNSSNKLKRALQPILTDPHRLNQRQKQIDMGKNTLGYEMYIKGVSRAKRNNTDPWTPDKYQTCSTRSWQGQMKIWRRRLHMWDPEECNVSEDPFSTSISFNSEGDTCELDSEDYQESLSEGCSQSSDDTRSHLPTSSYDETFDELGHPLPLVPPL